MYIHVGGHRTTWNSDQNATRMRRLPMIDLVHRGIVLSLVSLSAYGLYVGYASHRMRMERRRGSIRRLTFYLLSRSNNLVNASGGVTVAILLTVFRIDIHSRSILYIMRRQLGWRSRYVIIN